jgi:hypothetical protein
VLGLIQPYLETFTLRGFPNYTKKVWAAWGNFGIFFMLLRKIGHSGKFSRNVFQDAWMGSLGVLILSGNSGQIR